MRGEVIAGPGRPGESDEVEPAVRLFGGQLQSLVGGSRCNELDAAQVGALVRREVGDDQARRSGRLCVCREALVAVRLEERCVGHRHERHVDALARLRQALEAGSRSHSLCERPLRRLPDHGAVGQRVGEREAELDEVGAALDRGLRELGRVRHRTSGR